MANPLAAAKAYAAASQAFGGAASPMRSLTGGASADRPDFGAMVAGIVNNVAASGAQADQQTMAAVTGRADLVDVVTAVAESEAAIETLVAVRDRVIAAYEDIMRMPI